MINFLLFLILCELWYAVALVVVTPIRLQLRLQPGTVITIICLVSIGVTIESNHGPVTTASGKFRH
jgi:hypothetical protein